MKLLRLIIVLSIAGIAGLYCSHPSQPTTNLSDQYSIYLTGRVLDKDGKPMANAVAKLADKNLADTTGADGYYYITEKKAAGLPKTVAASVGDSLQVLKAGQVITYLDIPKWIDTLPDVFLIQRDIYGSLSPAPASFSRITATITGDSIPDSLAQIAVLGYIPATGNYSGFVYFVYTAQTLNYNVFVSVYNADTALIGRSMTVTFPSTAGDISMPTFDPNNAAPSVYAGNDTTVSINDTIRLHATASDSFGRHIVKWEWNINGGGFVWTSTGDTAIIAPPDPNPNYSCVVRVTDSDSNSVTDTMNVMVVGLSVVGVLYNANGTRAAGAQVKIIPVDYNPLSGSGVGIDSTVTDAIGRYRFNTAVSVGTYNLFASGSGNLVYQDSFMVTTGSTVNMPADTLKAPGSIKGVVQLQPGDDPRTVFILFMGTRIFTIADDTVGNFTTPAMAEGKYSVRILTTLPNYNVMDTCLIVIAGTQNVLPQPIKLQYTGIPVPSNLKYDTLHRIVTLTWDKIDTNIVKSYNVYKMNLYSDTVFTRINASPVIDNVYSDSTGIRSQTYEYGVTAVNKYGTEGGMSAIVTVWSLQ